MIIIIHFAWVPHSGFMMKREFVYNKDIHTLPEPPENICEDAHKQEAEDKRQSEKRLNGKKAMSKEKARRRHRMRCSTFINKA